MSVQEAAGSVLEETAEETASGVTEVPDVPGIDPVGKLRDMALSTSPNPSIDSIMAEEETDRGGAYLHRAMKKALGGVGWGDGAYPAILDAGIGLGHKAMNRGGDGGGATGDVPGVEGVEFDG